VGYREKEHLFILKGCERRGTLRKKKPSRLKRIPTRRPAEVDFHTMEGTRKRGQGRGIKAVPREESGSGSLASYGKKIGESINQTRSSSSRSRLRKKDQALGVYDFGKSAVLALVEKKEKGSGKFQEGKSNRKRREGDRFMIRGFIVARERGNCRAGAVGIRRD